MSLDSVEYLHWEGTRGGQPETVCYLGTGVNGRDVESEVEYAARTTPTL